MNSLEVLSTHFDIVFINSILKGNHKCIYYSIGNANGLEDQEILSQNTLLGLWRTLHVQESSQHPRAF